MMLQKKVGTNCTILPPVNAFQKLIVFFDTFFLIWKAIGIKMTTSIKNLIGVKHASKSSALSM